jgi:hypothetical protein
MPTANVFQSGPFTGVDVTDAFALAALSETPVTVKLSSVPWPANLAPTHAPLGTYSPGQPITNAVTASVDALILLYTEFETSALLDVFTGDPTWTPARTATWNPYGHNFDHFKPSIEHIDGNVALSSGYFGYLSAVKIGSHTVALYKSELHPKANGPALPFIPVVAQLISELAPRLVISTGTAGGIGSQIQCGDVVITNSARLHLRSTYPAFPNLDALSKTHTQLTNTVQVNDTYVQYAAQHLTELSLPGLAQCYAKIGTKPGYTFLKTNMTAPSIYLAGTNPVPGPEPMDVVSADYLTVDDVHDSEGLEALGIMNDTDDAFAFYAISTLPTAKQPPWLSVRNASEPQIVGPVDKLASLAGAIYGVYQYCTTLNSAFACWAVVAGM